MALDGADAVEARLEASRLTWGQREAVRTVLLSNNLAIGVQGHAGSGKTTMLREVKELLGDGLPPRWENSRYSYPHVQARRTRPMLGYGIVL